MAIANLVNYEYIHEHKLTDPNTDAPLGITFKIRSAGADEVKAIDRKHLNAMQKIRVKGKTQSVEALEKQTIEKCAAYVAGWNWGDQEFEKGKGVLEYNTENVTHVLETCDWIFIQVNQAANEIANFMKG